MNKFKKYIAAFMFAVMLITTVGVVGPFSVLAEAASIALYVSADGSDDNDGLSEETAIATLAKASTIANAAEEKSVTITILSDLTSNACARFYDKDVTIVGGSHTITRGSDFSTISDNYRSWYNPAMIEIQTAKESSSLKITNLTLDDANKVPSGANTYKYAPLSGKNAQLVQPAIIESTPIYDVNITLGEGTVLKNYAGMSAVRIAGPATLVMKSTSAIEGGSKGNGAIDCQNGAVVMETGSSITGMTGANAIFASNAKVTINGEIANNKFSHALQTGGNTETKIGSNGYIHDNSVNYGAVYINGTNDTLELYGKVNNNTSSDRAGGVAISNNGSNKVANMYAGAEINGNVSNKEGAGGLLISCGTFTMNGGTIKDNKVVVNAAGIGGGVHVRRGGTFIMNDGIISGNEAAAAGGGIAYEAHYYGALDPNLVLNGGTITDNIQNGDVSNDIAVIKTTNTGVKANNKGYGYADSYYVNNGAKLGNEKVFYTNGNFSLTSTDGTKQGNASKTSIDALTAASNSYGFGSPIATLWRSSDKTDLAFSDVTFDSSAPVYVIEMTADENGNAVSGTEKVYKATVAETINVTLPAAGQNGSVVALVQPTVDYGTLTISQDESITKDSRVDEYTVNYTENFDITDNLLSMMKVENGASDITFTVELDSRLAPNDDVAVNSPIFEKASAAVDGSTVTVTATLKDGWQSATGTTTVTGTATLAKGDFKVDDTLDSTATFKATVGTQKVLVPSDKASTLMKDEVLFTVTYDLQGGKSDDELVYTGHDFDTDIKKIADPTKDNNKFLGWYSDAEGKEKFDFSAPLTGDVTIYAVWEEITTTPTTKPTEPTTKIDDDTPLNPTKPSTTKPSSTTTTTTTTTAPATTAPATTNTSTTATTTRPSTTTPATTAPATTAPAEQTVIDEETPLALEDNLLESPDSLSIEKSSSWALLNVILVAVSLVAAVVETIKFASKKSKNNNGFAFIVAMFALVANALVLFMTEDFTAPMAFVDSYTVLNGMITLVGCVTAIVLSAVKKNNKSQKTSK